MTTKDFIVTAIFNFKSGNSKKVDWVEKNLTMQSESETGKVTAVPSEEDVASHFRKLFAKWKKEEFVLTVNNVMGNVSVIPFKEVEYATVSIGAAEEESESTEAGRPADIKMHPAFKQ